MHRSLGRRVQQARDKLMRSHFSVPHSQSSLVSRPSVRRLIAPRILRSAPSSILPKPQLGLTVHPLPRSRLPRTLDTAHKLGSARWFPTSFSPLLSPFGEADHISAYLGLQIHSRSNTETNSPPGASTTGATKTPAPASTPPLPNPHGDWLLVTVSGSSSDLEMSFTFNLSDPQLNPLTLAAISNPSRRADPPLRSPPSYTSLKSPTLSPMSSRLFHRKDRHRERDQDLRGTTDHLIDARQKKHVEDAFISSQLVELGLLDPRHAIGKQAARNRVDEIVNGTGRAEEYPKKNSSISHGTAVAPPHTSSHDPRPPSNQSNKKSTKSSGKSHRSKNSIGSTSLKSRAGGAESGMLDAQRRGTRRERTFVGTECAVCEEPLEHTLRGERILQFSCGHVSHGACFYEFLKMGGRAQGGEGEVCPSCERPLGLDTSRGGNVLDIEKITDMVRSASVKDREQATPTPSNWDSTNSSHATVRPNSGESRAAREPPRDYDREGMVSRQGGRDGRESAAGYRDERRDDRRDTRDTHQTRDTRHTNYTADARAMGRESHQTQQTQHTHNLSQHTNISQDRYQQEKALPQGHRRNDSEATGQHTTSSGGYQESQRIVIGHAAHPYDVAAMESDVLSSRSSVVKNPIPAPVVTVRAEFPTIERSRVQQTLTCLVTIEVPDNGWRADPVDLHLGNAGLEGIRKEERYARPPSPVKSIPPPPQSAAPRFYPYESAEVLEEMTEFLRGRVENWHGLDFSRFGKLRLYGTIRVGKDKLQWQELECYLFAEMLICVKEKKGSSSYSADGRTKCTLKGSILIKKHLEGVTQTSARDEIGLTQRITSSNLRAGEENILTLSLSVKELPQFHLQFENLNQLKLWQQALLDLHAVEGSPAGPRIQQNNGYDTDGREGETPEDDDWRRSHETGPSSHKKRTSSLNSSAYAGRSSHTTANTDYSAHRSMDRPQIQQALHVPVDIVLVVPISSSMQGVKMSLVRNALSYLVQALGPQDRMGLVTFGSSGGGVPLVGMTTKSWSGWGDILRNMRPVGQKLHRADVVDGANVAMDLLMQRKTSNPIATILLISDASTAENEPVDFVVSRAEAAKIAIHSFGLGLTHQPTTLLDLSSRTKGAYTYVKDWMMLRECLAGCLGALQSMSHQNAKLKLRLPEGSIAKFGKVSGATSVVKRASGRDVEASIGDLVWGGRRDILVQLIIAPDAATPAVASAGENDPWDSIMSSLDALAGPLDEDKSPRPVSIEEVPLLQADLSWGDLLRENTQTHLPRPTLLAITMLPPSSNNNTSTTPGRKGSVFNSQPAIPPHPSVVQRRMELLTSDMLSRALTLVGRGQQERAAHLLTETRSILKGLGKGGVLGGVGAPPPVPAIPLGGLPPLPATPATPLTPHTPLTPGGFNRRSPNYVNGYGHGHPLDGDSSSSSRERDRSRRSRDPSPANLSPATYKPGSAGFDVHTAPLPPPPGPPPSLPPPSAGMDDRPKTSSAPHPIPYPGGLVIDQTTVAALDQELEAALEWIHHPAVFSRDSRKAVLQAVGVVQDQRAWTTRTSLEKLVAERVGGVVKALVSAATWGREQDEDGGFSSGRPGGLEGVREES